MKLDKDWAHKLKAREEAGEKLNMYSASAWREALREPIIKHKKEEEKKKTIKVYTKM